MHGRRGNIGIEIDVLMDGVNDVIHFPAYALVQIREQGSILVSLFGTHNSLHASWLIFCSLLAIERPSNNPCAKTVPTLKDRVARWRATKSQRPVSRQPI